jgi:hypothetical protein
VGSAEIEEKRNLLRRRIQSWIEVRNIYVPALADDRETSPSAASNAHIAPELIPLKLPSSMTPALRSTCYQGLADIERRLRLAQAEDALYDLRKQLRITLGLTLYKTTQVGPSQRAGTRARALISRFRDKTMRCADRYRGAYSALTALDFGGEWCQRFRQLVDTDIRPPRKGDDEAEGTRALSWIWRVDRKNGLSGACSRDDLGPMGDEELSDCEYFYFEHWCGTNQYVQVFDANGRSRKLGLIDGGRRSYSSPRKCGVSLLSLIGKQAGGAGGLQLEQDCRRTLLTALQVTLASKRISIVH